MSDRMLTSVEFTDRVNEHLTEVLRPYAGQRATFVTVLRMKQDVTNVLQLFMGRIPSRDIERRTNEIVRRIMRG